MLYQATHWTRSKFEPALEIKETRIFGTPRAAELWARSVLEPVVTTRDCYHRDVGRTDSVDVAPVIRFQCQSVYALRAQMGYRQCGRKWTIEADVRIVPSVGELGIVPF
jgi:hypothetical protein